MCKYGVEGVEALPPGASNATLSACKLRRISGNDPGMSPCSEAGVREGLARKAVLAVLRADAQFAGAESGPGAWLAPSEPSERAGQHVAPGPDMLIGGLC